MSQLYLSWQHPAGLASNIQPGSLATTIKALQCIQLFMILALPLPSPRHTQQQNEGAEVLAATKSTPHLKEVH